MPKSATIFAKEHLVTKRVADGSLVGSIGRDGKVIELIWKNKGKKRRKKDM
jgi:hypothetical protein